MRNTLVIVPSFVAVPYRAKEEFVISTTLIHVCTCISVKVTYKLLHDDEVCKGLLIEVLAPSVFWVLVIAALESSLSLIDEVCDVVILSLVEVIILRILVCKLDTLAGVMVSFVKVSLDHIASCDLLRIGTI